MKNKIATAFEQIVTKSRIDVLMSKVNATLIASHQAGCLEQCEMLLNQYLDDVLNHIPLKNDEDAE